MNTDSFDFDDDVEDELSRFLRNWTEDDMGPGDWLADIDLLPSSEPVSSEPVAAGGQNS